MKELFERYKDMLNPPQDANARWYRTRGYNFEKLIYDMLEKENLEPSKSYKVKGEQIDGSFFYGERIFLVEAKWHKQEMSASSIYEFKGKVDGKLTGTLGIFISISGFSQDAVDALLYGKDVNILLFTQDDFEACLKDGFSNVLKIKLRAAAEKGLVYFPYERVVISENKQPTSIKQFEYDLFNNKLLESNTRTEIYRDIVIVCEGKTDQLILSLIINKISMTKKIGREVSIIVAMGKYSVANVVSNINANLDEKAKLIMVVDSDGDIERTNEMFKRKLDIDDYNLIIIDDRIEVWLGLKHGMSSNELKRNGRYNKDYITKLVESLDINDLKKNNSSFRKFYELVVNK